MSSVSHLICKRPPLMLLLLLGCLVIVRGHQASRGETCDLNQKCAAASGADQNIASRQANYYSPEANPPPPTKQNHEPIAASNECHFRAAVMEYNRIDLPDCHESAHFNLDNLETAARLAAQNGSQLVVFPEDAIVWAPQLNASLRPCLEEIPEPGREEPANPCLQSDQFGNFTILTRLSCLARDLSVYIVANFGTRETCDTKTDADCPSYNFRPLNTDVVLDPRGNYIARYRKYNPFVEVFAKAPRLEHAHFDTPFGRFGVFTCFDIIFRQPAIELVERFNIDTAIFPTWWYDELPILSALQFQDAWSARNRVNLLASNILKPSLGSTGSSIFAANNSVYVGAPNRRPKLIIANLARPNSGQLAKCAGLATNFAPVVLDLPSAEADESYAFKNYAMGRHLDDEVFPLSANVTDTTVCARRVCCRLRAKFNGEPAEGRLVLLVRDARRLGRFPWAEQVCFVATLGEKLEAGKPLRFSQTHLPGVSFESLSLEARFDTEYVYPVAAHNVSRLLDRTKRGFRCVPSETSEAGETAKRRHKCRLSLNDNNPDGTQLYSFGVYGRLYDEDGRAHEDVHETGGPVDQQENPTPA